MKSLVAKILHASFVVFVAGSLLGGDSPTQARGCIGPPPMVRFRPRYNRARMADYRKYIEHRKKQDALFDQGMNWQQVNKQLGPSPLPYRGYVSRVQL